MPTDDLEANRTASLKVPVSLLAVPFRCLPIVAMPLVRRVTPPVIPFYS